MLPELGPGENSALVGWCGVTWVSFGPTTSYIFEIFDNLFFFFLFFSFSFSFFSDPFRKTEGGLHESIPELWEYLPGNPGGGGGGWGVGGNELDLLLAPKGKR